MKEGHVVAGFQMVVLPIRAADVLRLSAIAVKLKGLYTIYKSFRGLYSRRLIASKPDDGCWL